MKLKIALVLIALTGNANANEIRMGLATGQGDIKLSNKFNTEDSIAGEAGLSGSIYLGYMFEDKYIVDLMYSSTGDDLFVGLFDNVHIDSISLQFGYRANFDKFYLEPRVGLAQWDLKLEEGFFLNPGREQVSEDEGTDVVLALAAGYNFTPLFGLSLSYTHFEFEHGKSTSLMMGADFKF